MNIELLKEEMQAANERIQKEREYISRTKQEIANYLCPFSVGDNVVSPNGEKIIIASIKYSGWGAGYDFKAFKIKKDGNPYKDSQNVYDDVIKYTLAT